MKKNLIIIFLLIITQGCSAMTFKATNKKLDLEKFMGTWYVQKGRVTMLEDGAHNPIEHYEYDQQNDKIIISFSFNKDSLTGKEKKIPQTGYVQNAPTNTYWKVSPIWPLKFDYLVLDFDKNYEWTAIGVPSGKYLWIMTREKNPSKEIIDLALDSVSNISYPLKDIETFQHNH